MESKEGSSYLQLLNALRVRDDIWLPGADSSSYTHISNALQFLQNERNGQFFHLLNTPLEETVLQLRSNLRRLFDECVIPMEYKDKFDEACIELQEMQEQSKMKLIDLLTLPYQTVEDRRNTLERFGGLRGKNRVWNLDNFQAWRAEKIAAFQLIINECKSLMRVIRDRAPKKPQELS